MTDAPPAGTDEWRALVDEPIVDPDQRMVDAHHHLWRPGEGMGYGLAELLADVGSGHDVARTVFVECGSSYPRVDRRSWRPWERPSSWRARPPTAVA